MPSFFSLIDRLNAVTLAERGGIEEAIWDTFGVEKALLALDMSHFSLTVRRSGIVPYLGLIRRMQVLSASIVQQCRGTVVKYHADNLMAVFPDAGDAAAAAVAINRTIASGPPVDGQLEFSVGIGIDYGRFLMVEREDCYGDAVNVAYKLGEDLARPGEILITAAARARLDPAFPHPLQEQPVSLSGLELIAYSIRYRENP